MRIQNLLLPRVGICDEESLYFRRAPGSKRGVFFDAGKSELRFDRHAACLFNTYFNCLTAWKWRKYTNAGAFSLHLRLRGQFEVTLINAELINGAVSSSVVARRVVGGGEVQEFAFPYEVYEYKGVFTFSLRALEDGSVFCGGWYGAEIAERDLQTVNIAVNICTFKREPFILRNIDILRREILNNAQNDLCGHLRVYISDNGQTLGAAVPDDRNICVVPNKNVGGAGGFTRGLIEIMAHADEFPATHALMMDDDIVIEPESLFRTYTMLRCRKADCRDVFVGGAMFRLDNAKIQVESGAFWNAGRLMSNKANLDMSAFGNCLFNELEEYTEYNAWWYCCVPMSVVNEKNLPLPIFIRGDDVEYGLRNMKKIVLLNGICVWHEPFENKYSSTLYYYILRNLLYDNALHAQRFGLARLLPRLCKAALRELCCYRYKNAWLLFRGVEDFLKGVDFLKDTDGAALHREIMAAGYRAVPWEELSPYGALRLGEYEKSLRQSDGKLHRLVRLATLNGHLLPAKRIKGKRIPVVSMARCRLVNFYRQKRVLNYDPASGKGFITERSLKEACRVLTGLLSVSVRACVLYPGAKARIREDIAQVQNSGYWKKYLGIDGEGQTGAEPGKSC